MFFTTLCPTSTVKLLLTSNPNFYLLLIISNQISIVPGLSFSRQARIFCYGERCRKRGSLWQNCQWTSNVGKENEEKNKPGDKVEVVVGDLGLGRHLVDCPRDVSFVSGHLG